MKTEIEQVRYLAQQIGSGLITIDEFVHKRASVGTTREYRVVGTQANGFPIDKVVCATTAGLAALSCEIEGSWIASVTCKS